MSLEAGGLPSFASTSSSTPSSALPNFEDDPYRCRWEREAFSSSDFITFKDPSGRSLIRDISFLPLHFRRPHLLFPHLPFSPIPTLLFLDGDQNSADPYSTFVHFRVFQNRTLLQPHRSNGSLHHLLPSLLPSSPSSRFSTSTGASTALPGYRSTRGLSRYCLGRSDREGVELFDQWELRPSYVGERTGFEGRTPKSESSSASLPRYIEKTRKTSDALKLRDHRDPRGRT